MRILRFFVCTFTGVAGTRWKGEGKLQPYFILVFRVSDLNFCVKFHVPFSLQCRYVHFLFHFSYIVYKIFESENLFDIEAYLQPPNEGLNSDEDSGSEKRTDPEHLSSVQLIAQAHIRIVCSIHITNSVEAECDDKKMLAICKEKFIRKMRAIGEKEVDLTMI